MHATTVRIKSVSYFVIFYFLSFTKTKSARFSTPKQQYHQTRQACRRSSLCRQTTTTSHLCHRHYRSSTTTIRIRIIRILRQMVNKQTRRNNYCFTNYYSYIYSKSKSKFNSICCRYCFCFCVMIITFLILSNSTTCNWTKFIE